MTKLPICGKYLGRGKVRPGREDELSPTERKQLEKAAPIELELRPDGSFTKQVTDGVWKAKNGRVSCQPLRFGGKTEEEMRDSAAAMGRSFGLKFVFFPFDLEIEGETLATCDHAAVIYTEYVRQ